MSSSMRHADNYPRISVEELTQRRAKLIARGLDPDAMSQLDRDWTVEWSPSVEPQPQSKAQSRATTQPILKLTPPERFEPITDADWKILERYVPINPKSPMTTRSLLDICGQFVIEGMAWGKIDPVNRCGSIRARLRHARLALADKWRNLELVARREFNEPRRTQLIRISRYVSSGDRSVMAARTLRNKNFLGQLRRRADDKPTRPTLAPVR